MEPIENELKLLQVYLGVHPNSEIKDRLETRITTLQK